MARSGANLPRLDTLASVLGAHDEESLLEAVCQAMESLGLGPVRQVHLELSEESAQPDDALPRAELRSHFRVPASTPWKQGAQLALPVLRDDDRVVLLWLERELAPGELAAAERMAAALSERLVRQGFLRERSELHRLKENEALFRTLAEHVPGVVYLCRNDARYSMIYLNQEVEALTGHTAEDFMEDRISFVELYHPEDQAAIFEQVDAALEAREPFHLLYRIRHRDGSLEWLEERGQGVFDEECGELLLLEGTVFDVTPEREAAERQEQLEERLRQAQKLESLGLLAGGVAHDFNNLLFAITGSAEVALLQSPNEPVDQLLKSILDTCQRATELTRQMLTYAGQAAVEMRPLDFSHQVEEVCQLVQSAIARKVKLEVELAPDLPAVMADAGQLHQVVMNLVMNGAEAIGERPGRVQVRTDLKTLGRRQLELLNRSDEAEPGQYVCLEVRDDGIGMAAETQERIFDPFFTTKRDGRGLGLASVLGIVRAHRGAIEVESTPEQGSVFRVCLPATSRIPVDRPVPASPPPKGQGLVLIVDDEADNRRLLAQQLELLGYDSLTAEDGQVALERFAAGRDELELILLDVSMPVLDGLEVFARIRESSDIPVILISGYTDAERIGEVLEGPNVSFLPKPFSFSALAQELRFHLGQETEA